MKRVLSALGVLSLALSVTACATTTFQTGPMRQSIVEDVGAFNDAYAQAASNLILWNVLRARDRLPRNYVAIQTITTTRSRSVENRFDLESLDFGGGFAADPWGVGKLGATTTSGSEPGFGVAPVVAERINQAVLAAVPSEVFVRYWQTWGPEDVLMAVLVDRMTRLRIPPETLSRLTCLSRDINDFSQRDRAALADVLVRNASERGTTPLRSYFRAADDGELKNQIDEPIGVRPDSPDREGDAFLQLARLIKEHPSRVRVRQVELGACGDTQRIRIAGGGNAVSHDEASRLLTAMTAARANGWSAALSDGAIEFAPPASVAAIVLEISANASEEDPFGEADGLWELEIRSLDQAIYYLGETIRQPTAEIDEWNRSRDPAPSAGARRPSMAPQVYGLESMVTADCSRQGAEASAPLFRVRRTEPRIIGAPETQPEDAAAWQFDEMSPAARVRYRGAIYESGPPSPLNSSCRALTDFSGQVLTLLTQLLAANLSQESTEAPARIN